jgi:lipopolysaccharide/colanic/teichoic acid biosynthesis glycosyltransferase
VGPWEENDKVSQSVRHDLESDPRVVLVGSQHDVAPFYKCMSMFVYPSHGTEGFPNAPMEAAAMALPVIASRVVGCVDAVVDGITGALVPPRDPRALAAAIRRYFKDPELRWEHGRAGRERVVRDFRQELIWEAFYQVYLQALKKEGRRGAGLAPEGGAPSGEDGGVGSAGQAGIGGPSWPPGRARRATAGAIKRLIDVAAASAGLVVLAPLLAIMAMSIRLMMGRPVLFRQVRPGYRARPFVLYKFRTMREAYGPDGTPLPDADRLTRLGRFLRKTSLDELPQLWNVLRGDLSLVGPRPLLMQYLPLYTVEQARRHNVRPGITGWAQVNGRNAISWEEKFRYDIWYIDHWSLWLDLKILAMTLGKVLGRAGISPPGQATMSEFTGIGAGNDAGLQGVTSD